MAEKPIRIGIIGAGGNTQRKHIPGLRTIDGVEIIGVVNRSPESSAKAAKALSIPKTYPNWLDLVRDPDIDAVCIGTWPYMHCATTVAALEAGKHVLCEARMAMNASEARLMLRAAQARPHLVAQIVPAPHTLGVDKTVQRLIAEGYLGRILAVEVREGGGFFNPDSPMHWRDDIDLSGFNIMGMGIWYESIMRWVGDARSLTAMGKTFATMRKDSEGILRPVRVPEHIDVLADMICGAQLHLQISKVTGLMGPGHATVYGETGTLRFQDGKLLGGKKGDTELKEIQVPENERGGWRVEEEFINAIRGKEPITHTPLHVGVKYMDFTEAVWRSAAAGGQRIDLPLEE